MEKIAELTSGPGLGDELILSGIANILKKNNYFIKLVVENYPELFENNPNVDNVRLTRVKENLTVSGLNKLLLDFGIRYKKQIFPEIYLTKEEIKYGENEIDKIRDERFLVAFVPHSKSHQSFLSDGWDIIINDTEIKEKLNFLYFGQRSFNGIVNFTNKIRETASIIKKCDLYIGVNTGLYHIAKCFKLTGLVINWPKHRYMWGYDDDIHVENGFDSNKFLSLVKEKIKELIKEN